MFYLIVAGHHGPSGGYSGPSRKVSQRNLRASLSDSNRVSTSPSRTGPLTFRMMERLVSSINSTRTCVHCPCEPVLPSTLVTLASLMGCTRLVSMMAAIRRSSYLFLNKDLFLFICVLRSQKRSPDSLDLKLTY